MADNGETENQNVAQVPSSSMASESIHHHCTSINQTSISHLGATPKPRAINTIPLGIIPLPPGSRGPRSLYLRRHENGFGFTLRHFIVYPPEPEDGSGGPSPQPMDTIFVKKVADGGAGALAGLRQGDRIVAVNGHSIAGLSYAQVVTLIKRSPPYLHLLVVPQQDDVLQKFFSETAHNPETNQRPSHQDTSITYLNPSLPSRVAMIPQNPSSSNTQLARTAPPGNFQEVSVQLHHPPETAAYCPQENIYNIPNDSLFNINRTRTGVTHERIGSNIYSEPIQRTRAQPQTPTGRIGAQPQVPTSARPILRRQSIRRSSEGSTVSDSSKDTRTSYESADYCSINSERSSVHSSDNMVVNNNITQYSNEKRPNNDNHLVQQSNSKTNKTNCTMYPNQSGCRLSLDAGRRESAASLSSSVVEGSKDSLSSFGSSSTLTGQDTDDSVIMSRFRKSLEKKEEFLRRPSQPTGFLTSNSLEVNSNEPINVIQREFYGRPQKLQKQMWPPTMCSKPLHQDFERIKSDLDIEKEYIKDKNRRSADRTSLDLDQCYMSDSETQYHSEAMMMSSPLQKSISQRDKGAFATTLSRIHENIPATVANFGADDNGTSSNSSEGQRSETNSPYPAVVWRRTRQFESGRPIPDEETCSLSDRTSLYSSELARLSSKRVVPNVAVRKREFETRTEELNRELRRERESLRRLVNRESRSLESSGKNYHRKDAQVTTAGNMIVPIGSKYLHCIPPSDFKQTTPEIVVEADNDPERFRARSNSADSWAMAMQHIDDDHLNIAGGWRGRTHATLDWRATPKTQEKLEEDRLRHKAVRQDSYLAAVRGPTVKTTDQRNNQVVQQPRVLDEKDEPQTNPALSSSCLEQTRQVPINNQNDKLYNPNASCANYNNINSNQISNKVNNKLIDSSIVTNKKPAVRPTHLPISDPIGMRLISSDDFLHIDDDLSPDPSGDGGISNVVRRNNLSPLGDEERAMRRVSYLKATLGDRMLVDGDYELSDSEDVLQPQALRSAHRRWRPPLFPGDIQQLLRIFEQHPRPILGSCSPGSSNITSVGNGDKENFCPIIKQGPMHCKVTIQDGKRSTDRSWKQIWVVLRGPQLLLYRSHNQSPMGLADLNADVITPPVDVRYSYVDVADDYTKRKNVFRVSSMGGAELLLQAEGPTDMLHWVRALQDQATNETEEEMNTASKQQAVPQQVPAGTSVQVQGSTRLSPLPGHKSIKKLTSFRNRSPTGQSPVNKTRKPSQVLTDNLPSPKSKTWGRVVKQFRKIHQSTGSPSSPTAPEGATIGIPLEMCPPSTFSEFVPLLVEVCTKIVEERGLDVVGVYRVPGNTAAITLLTEEVNKGFTEANLQDPRWNDVNVVSSLLKSFFRRLPDSLLTVDLYPKFIEADKIDDNNCRLTLIRKLLNNLPDHHFETLKYLMQHLKRVVEHSEVNKMEARNLAIVFGPTLVRAGDDNMVQMVTDMSHQCRIVESLLSYVDWFFTEEGNDNFTLPPPTTVVDGLGETDNSSAIANHSLLINNIDKIEGIKSSSTGKEVAKVIKSTIISAAHRKIQRGSKSQTRSNTKNNNTDNSKTETGKNVETLEEEILNNESYNQTNEALNVECIPSTVHDLELAKSSEDNKQRSPSSTGSRPYRPTINIANGTIRTYAGLSASTQERIRRFEQETRAMLARRRLEEDKRKQQEMDWSTDTTKSFYSNTSQSSSPSLSSNGSNLSNKLSISSRLSEDGTKSDIKYATINSSGRLLMKNSSASNILSTSKRFPSSSTTSSDNSNNSKNGSTSIVFGGDCVQCQRFNEPRSRNSISAVPGHTTNTLPQRFLRRGNSVENVNLQNLTDTTPVLPSTISVNGTLKRFKTGKEISIPMNASVAAHQRCGSLDSLDKMQTENRRLSTDLSDDGSDLLTSLTTTFDRKLKSLLNSSTSPPPTAITIDENIPFFDESPEKPNIPEIKEPTNKPFHLADPPFKLFRNPSLHKTKLANEKSENLTLNLPSKLQKEVAEKEKDEDSKESSSADSESMPDNDRVVEEKNNNHEKVLAVSSNSMKLKRSESLNKADVHSKNTPNGKLKRSESLNRTSDKNEKLHRADSLTKTEKTECNISKKRELGSAVSSKRSFSTKLKRKNGMPERSIKRRHTVGGTKDFDKAQWLDNRLSSQDDGQVSGDATLNNDDYSGNQSCQKQKPLRTSSPDLTRRERFLLEVSLLGPEGMIVALRKHLSGPRPHSLPEAKVYKVPLESHV